MPTSSPMPSRLLVLGSPRSGTTWTSEVLGTAPGARLVHEPDNEVNDPYALTAKVGLGRFPAVDRRSAPDRYVELWRVAFEHGLTSTSLRARLAEQLIRRTPRSLRDDVLLERNTLPSSALRSVLRATARPREAGGASPLTIVKSVHAAFSAEMVAELSQATVLVIMRHPLNVLSSWIEFEWPPQRLEERPECVELAGLSHVERFGATSDNERRAISYAILHRRFERLLEDNPGWIVADHDAICDAPASRFRQLFDEIGLAWTPDTETMIDETNTPGTGYDTKRVASEQRDAWRTRLDDRTVAEVTTVLAHYGIDVATHPTD